MGGILSAALLAGCGDGSVEDSTAQMRITALDGYLQGAMVWLDLDGDFELDQGEPSATTDENGLFLLDVAEPSDAACVVVKVIPGETIDMDQPSTPVRQSYLLTAPPGGVVVSPLTTLVELERQQQPGITTEQAILLVANRIGALPEEITQDYLEREQTQLANQARSLVAVGLVPSDAEQALDGAELLAMVTQVEDLILQLTEDETLIWSGDELVVVVNDDDDDDDGVADDLDAFPNDSAESADSDGDGVGDNADAFPLDPAETLDSDSDGVGDNADAFPLDPAETLDSDSDGVGDNADAFPLDPAETLDSDGDGVGDNADALPLDPAETLDSDSDGVGDNADAFPLDPAETLDSDSDGVGDNADTFPLDPAETLDSDGDGVGDNADAFPLDPQETADSDGDGIGNNSDAFPDDPNETVDSDGDGVGDNADAYPQDPEQSVIAASYDTSRFDTAQWQ
ncbi:hypothetical protein [Aliagarivorans taiwanensis]|uniref:hypothetical protein n=1 Tax=Aliagarivorans taiwanensis TaxID=561966 RepID=UPI00040CAC39|nr:hypothetical protein [Aliagarivorans taiwanensis]